MASRLKTVGKISENFLWIGKNTTDRRMENINILVVRRHTTARELAEEFGVTTCTIRNDIQALSPGYPIYTQQGGAGGIFIGEDYKPYINTLSSDELKSLCEISFR